METMQTWVERSISRENERTQRAQNQDQLKLTKLTESEDIESYLVTFKRMMQVHAVEEAVWAFRFAPQLTPTKSQECPTRFRSHHCPPQYEGSQGKSVAMKLPLKLVNSL